MISVKHDNLQRNYIHIDEHINAYSVYQGKSIETFKYFKIFIHLLLKLL